MALALRTNGNGNRALARDPFSLARELLNWDPFFAGRPLSAFAPAFEVKETTDAFVLRADLPGVEDKDLDVAVHAGVLTVSGSRQAEERKEGESYALYERQFGSFSRSFALPELADPDRVDAKLEQGVLTLTIGKKAEAKPRKIAIKK
jgi:HSP20 family protein